MNVPQDTQSDRPVPLLDMSRAHDPLKSEILAALERVVDSGRFLHGPEVKELEQSVAQLCEVDHAIACASGSDALLLALMACDIGPGDEVLVPSFTFFATASAVWRLGARIVFVDIDPATFNLDPALIERRLTPATKAIIPVHLFGQCAAMDSICQIAERHGLWVIEDAAQAIAARYHDRPAGSWGQIGCFSFYPTKNLGGMGDGGMLTTGDEHLAQRLRLLAAHGMEPRYYHQAVGINSRLDTLQAAVLNVKLRHLPAATSRRQQNAARYHELFRQAGLDNTLGLPATMAGGEHVWNQYTIRVPHGRRDALRAHLAQQRIGSEVYYPIPLHLQQCFQPLGYAEGSLVETETAAREVLSLPNFPELTADEQQRVVAAVHGFYQSRQVQAA
ncbi:MAG: DegT/DnrJ/EryC1/StrS family aminotransferase [Pirellulaceae bacterium]|nr:DegT/DnrJ/EryC1/StrS family aminotransferase [Pirellulaceae bacterium]